MTIQAWHIMKEKISVGPDTSARDTALKLIASGLPAMPIVSDAMQVVGLATEHALLGAIRERPDLENVTAASLAVKPPLTAEVNTSVEDLIEMMQNNNCCSVIIIMNNKKYAGVVSRHLIMDILTSPHYSRFAQKDRKAPFVCL